MPKQGGQYTEGILGQPRFINPVLSATNDADRDLVRIIYSSLFKYDGQGNLINDLAEDYQISEDGLTYTIILKKDVLWHDQEPLTADDVVFTIRTIQNAEYKSPLRNNWQGVEVEKIDSHTISFTLGNIYAPFLHNLTIGILPKHLWGGVSASNFALAEYNFKPVGSGPYKFKEFSKDTTGKIKSIELERNENYYSNNTDNVNQAPYIEKITFKFFNSQTALMEAVNKQQIDGLSFISAAEHSQLTQSLKTYEISLPIYYAVFFNQNESKVLVDDTVREALAYATDKNEIINKVLKGKGQPVDSPFLSNWPFYASTTKIYDFALEHANNILESAGWKNIDDDPMREKSDSDKEDQGSELVINLLTTDWPELRQTAELLKSQWEKIGAQVNIDIVEAGTIQQEHIKPRKYQALLFGEVLNADPDPFAFWHSSQSKDPGINLALYKNKDVDKLLEDGRQTLEEEERLSKYAELQELITDDLPALFLYNPDYLYPVTSKIRGIEIDKLPQHSFRFSQIENWYIKTQIIWR